MLRCEIVAPKHQIARQGVSHDSHVTTACAAHRLFQASGSGTTSTAWLLFWVPDVRTTPRTGATSP